MSAALIRRNDALDLIIDLQDMALRHLITAHGRDVPLGDLPWLGGILGQIRGGTPLKPEQVARVSAIRALLARRCHCGR